MALELFVWSCYYIHECRYISICYVGLRLLWGDSICGGVSIYMCRYISICYVGMQLVWGNSIGLLYMSVGIFCLVVYEDLCLLCLCIHVNRTCYYTRVCVLHTGLCLHLRMCMYTSCVVVY